MIGLLTVLIFLPVVMAVPTFLFGKKRTNVAKLLGVGTTATVFALSVIIVVLFQYGSTGFQFTDTASWASSFGLNYVVGIDGISLPLLIIATFLCLLAALGSRDMISLREPEYYALFLLFETGIIGVFTSLNLILFYVFWEVVLIPMFFFIGIWGGPRRKYASLKFLIFTYAGSAIMLFGFVALYAWTGSTGSPSFDASGCFARDFCRLRGQASNIPFAHVASGCSRGGPSTSQRLARRSIIENGRLRAHQIQSPALPSS